MHTTGQVLARCGNVGETSMQPDTPLDEKDSALLYLISEHAQTQKRNAIGIPMAHLLAKGFDISDTNNTLWRLKGGGVIKRFAHGWGFFEVVSKGKMKFVLTSAEEPVHDDDFEAYEIEVI